VTLQTSVDSHGALQAYSLPYKGGAQDNTTMATCKIHACYSDGSQHILDRGFIRFVKALIALKKMLRIFVASKRNKSQMAEKDSAESALFARRRIKVEHNNRAIKLVSVVFYECVMSYKYLF